MELIKGVEILNQYKIGTFNFWWLLLIWLAMLFVSLCMVAFFFREVKVMAIFLGIAVASIFLAMLVPKYTLVQTRYEVIISDDVSINDFLEQYEIIEQHREICIIEERVDWD